MLTNNVELGISFDGYSQTVDTSYRDYTRPDGGEIFQSLKLRHAPARRLGALRAHEQEGQDRRRTWAAASTRSSTSTRSSATSSTSTTRSLPIDADAFVADGTAFGVHALGGLRVYINRDFAIVGEGRYQWAKDDMGDDFSPTSPGSSTRSTSRAGRPRSACTSGSESFVTTVLAGHEARGLADPLALGARLPSKPSPGFVSAPRGVAHLRPTARCRFFETRGFRPLVHPGCSPRTGSRAPPGSLRIRRIGPAMMVS